METNISAKVDLLALAEKINSQHASNRQAIGKNYSSIDSLFDDMQKHSVNSFGKRGLASAKGIEGKKAEKDFRGECRKLVTRTNILLSKNRPNVFPFKGVFREGKKESYVCRIVLDGKHLDSLLSTHFLYDGNE